MFWIAHPVVKKRRRRETVGLKRDSQQSNGQGKLSTRQKGGFDVGVNFKDAVLLFSLMNASLMAIHNSFSFMALCIYYKKSEISLNWDIFISV